MGNAIRKATEFLGSIRLALILLIIITVISLFGIIIPQGLPEYQYVHKWGPSLSKVLLPAGFDHVFSAIWFYLLLGLFSLNILVCSITRLWKTASHSLRQIFLSSDQIPNFSNTFMFSSPASCTSVKDSLRAQLKKSLYITSLRNENEGYQISAAKGMIKDLGSLLFHLSIVVLFIGGLIGALFGYSKMVMLRSGDIADVPERSFKIRCDWFKLDRDGQGTIKDYTTKLAVLTGDKQLVFDKVIEVNKPLSYDGIRFYQNSYSQDPRRVSDVFITISGPDLGKGFTGSVPYDTNYHLPNTAISVRISNFVSDFVIDMNTREVSSRSDEPRNPAVKVIMTNDNDTLYKRWVFFKFPGQHSQDEKYQVTATDYTPQYTTGIQMRKNPGVPVIWAGIICMSLGIFAVFYVARKNLWILIQPSGNGSRIIVCGRSGSAPAAFRNEFETICASLRSSIRQDS